MISSADVDLVAAALAEDIGAGDLTSQYVIDADTEISCHIQAKQCLVLAGLEIAAACFQQLDPDISIHVHLRDGDVCPPGERIATIQGNARHILTAERTALNFLQHLSGIATLTRQYVDAVAGTDVVILDTRKTIPGLRTLAKYATRMGGAQNHRMRLDDAIMIKDNHLVLCGSLETAVGRAVASGCPHVIVECDTLEQVAVALKTKATRLLLDNMDCATLRHAVALVGGKIPLEASGGISLDNIRQIAETGVNFISIGRITHSAPAVDIGLEFV